MAKPRTRRFAILAGGTGGHIFPALAVAREMIERGYQVHWFGTDEVGNDVFTRVVLGTRVTLQIACIVTGVAMLIGVPLGMIAGYFGGWVQETIMRVTDVFLSVPGLVLAIAIAGRFALQRGGGDGEARVRLCGGWVERDRRDACPTAGSTPRGCSPHAPDRQSCARCPLR